MLSWMNWKHDECWGILSKGMVARGRSEAEASSLEIGWHWMRAVNLLALDEGSEHVHMQQHGSAVCKVQTNFLDQDRVLS